MKTHSSSKFVGEPFTNPTSTNPKCRNRRRSKQRVEPFALDEVLVVTMAGQRTMSELLRAPTEGYAKAIVVPSIPAEHFELKHSLINLVTSKQFFGFEKEDPHAHIRYFNKITSTLKYKDVPETSIKLMLFPFSIDGPARIWLNKEPPRSILTWDDLVSKFINHFFPPSKTTNLRNEISNFQQRFDESFYEAWDRFKDLLRACPHHGFTELHQLDTFYNGLNPSDQDSLNSAAGGNLLERSAQDVLKIIENKSKVCNSRNKPIVSQVKASNVDSSEIASVVASVVTLGFLKCLLMTSSNPTPASIKVVEESCVTCGGAHILPTPVSASYGQTTFSVITTISKDMFQPPQLTTIREMPDTVLQVVLTKLDHRVLLNHMSKIIKTGTIKKTNEASMQAMRNHIGNLKSELRNEMQATMLNQTNELKNMMAGFFQMNTASSSGSGQLPSNTIANLKGELKAITTQSGIVLDGPSVLMPPPFINPEEHERAEETLTDPELVEYTIKVPPPLVQNPQAPS
ncbi:reverse transcriptase domain-containing protein [Tanacetum coccineum]